jgi:hypothetical protein
MVSYNASLNNASLNNASLNNASSNQNPFFKLSQKSNYLYNVYKSIPPLS